MGLLDSKLDQAAAKFDELSDLELKPAVELVDDPVRHQFEQAVVIMLGLPKDRALSTIEVCRDWWSREPTVNGKDPV